MSIEVLKPGATNYHITRCGEIDQPYTIGGSVCVESELPDSGAKDTFSSDLRIKISEDDFCVLVLALIIYVPAFNVEGIFKYIVLSFNRVVSTNLP